MKKSIKQEAGPCRKSFSQLSAFCDGEIGIERDVDASSCRSVLPREIRSTKHVGGALVTPCIPARGGLVRNGYTVKSDPLLASDRWLPGVIRLLAAWR